MKEELPKSWVYARLDQISTVVAGNPAPQGEEYFSHGKYNFVRVRDLGEHSDEIFLKTTRDKINGKATKKLRLFPSGSILFTKSGASTLLNQRVILAKDSYVVSHIAAAISFKGIETKWIFYFLKLVDFATLAHATNMPSLPLSRAKAIKIPIAPIDEQLRVVSKIEELFSALDKGIESLKTAREQLKVYRQAVLKHAFEGKLTEQWREENKHKLEPPEQLLARIKKERNKRHQQQLEEWNIAVKVWELKVKRGKKPNKPKFPTTHSGFKQDEFTRLPVLPIGYTYTHLSNLGDLSRGKSKHRPRKDPVLFSGNYPFIQTGEVKASNRIIREYSKTYNDVGLAQSKLWPKGTLCITIAANIAETAFLGFDACFPDSIVGFTANSELVIPEYVELFFKASRASIEAYAPATAQKNINLATLERLIIPYCSIEEQNIIVNQLEDIFTAIDKTQNEIECSLQITELNRQSILKRAFSGQLVEQDPNEEPASILLERIEAEKTEQEKTRRKNNRKKMGEVIV